jgi:hypothetical protein
MKKILLLVFLFVLGKMSYSQGYPLTQNLGSDSTIVVSKGALQSRLIPIVITDTNAANAQRLKSYPGAQLYTTAGDFYIRNSNATKWILVSSGSSGSVNIYTADGTLTGNRTLTGANNNLTFTGLNKFTVSTGDTTLFNTNTFGIKGVGGVLNVEGTAAGTTSSLTLKTASDGNWTISTGVAGLELGDLRFYDNDNGGGSARMIIKSTGKVGIGTETPDSMLSVAQGAYFGRGIIAPNLPSALGTKALRIDAQGKISVADTTLGGGTVIQVNTNDGSGITGGPITVSGTLAIDTTNVIATKLSVAGGLAGKLNISDTANMLKNYVNQVGYALTKTNQVVSADSATLSNYYLRRKDSLTATNSLGYVTKKVLADTAAAIRSSDAGGTVTSVATNNSTGITGGAITTSGTLAIDTLLISTRAWRQKGVDSVSGLLSGYVPSSRTLTINGTTQDLSANRTYNVGTVTSVATNYGLSGGTITTSGTLSVDSATLSNYYLRRKDSLTATNLLGYVTRKVLADTAAAIRGSDAGGTVTSVATNNGTGITGGTITTSGTLAIDTTVISTRAWRQKGVDSLQANINLKLNISDTSSMLFPYLRNVGYGLDKISAAQLVLVDTLEISTRAWRQKGIDSVAALINSNVSGTTNRVAKFTGANTVGSSSIEDSSSSVAMTINSSGKVGIGTTNPQSSLQVSGSISAPTGNGVHMGISSNIGIIQLNGSSNAGGIIDFGNGSSGIALGRIFYSNDDNLFRIETNGSEAMRITSSGNVGIGTSAVDSMLTVYSGTYLQRGVRMSGLPSAPGTKALRIDASGTLSYADTLIDAGGTVTSVATNNGTGITGGTITTSGTLAIDTTVISTRAWRQKGIDSVASLITGSYVPLSRTLTINGTSFDLSANRTWNVGTVTTAAASGGGQVAFFNGSTVITSVTGLYFDGTNKLAIGSSSPDSMLSVTQGAHIQRGVRLSGLPTAPGTRSLRIDANGTLSVSDTLANGMSGSGTPNYIPKFTGSSSIGNSVIYESSGSIGINTISPNSKLEIYDNSTGSILTFNSNTNGSARGLNWRNNPTANNFGSITADYTSGVFTYDAGLSVYAGQHVFRVGTSGEQMRLTSTGLGIGTSSPAYKLVVNSGVDGISAGIAGSTYGIRFDNGGTFSSGMSTIHGVDATLVGSYQPLRINGSDLRFATSATERMRLDASGNLGLGVTPSAWGSGYIAQQIGTRTALISGTLGQTFIGNNNYNNGTNWLYLQTAATSLYEQYAGSHVWYNAPSGTAGNAISFTQAMTLDASGRLGIGTTSPSELLDVRNSYREPTSGEFTQLLSSITTQDAGRGGSLGFGGFTNGTSGYTTFSGIKGFKENGDGGNTAGALAFYTRVNGGAITERMRITSGGNVGIGTTSPNIVGVTGTVTTINTTTTSAYGGLELSYQGSSIASFLNNYNLQVILSSRTAIPLIFETNASERMRITSGGNVGIGTTGDASYKLLVKGNNASVDANGQNTIYLSAGTSVSYLATSYIGGGSYVPIAFEVGGSERMRITSGGAYEYRAADGVINFTAIDNSGSGASDYGSFIFNLKRGVDNDQYPNVLVLKDGNVGIGTTSPTSISNYVALTINGTSGSFTEYQQGGSYAFRVGSDNSEGGFISQTTANPIRIFTNASERMRITSGGNVLIGTTIDDGYPLQVSTGVYVRQAATGYSFAGPSSEIYTIRSGSLSSIIYFNNSNVGDIASINGTTGAYTAISDSAKKKDFEPSTLGLNAVLGLKPTLYRMKNENDSIQKHLGFLAQEVKNYIPQAYVENEKMIGLDYNAIIPVLVNAIKELKAEIEVLKNK